MKNSLHEYTESEFLDEVRKAYSGNFTEEESNEFIEFIANTGHPNGTDIIAYPTSIGLEDSPEAVVQELKRWSLENGENCFKDA